MLVRAKRACWWMGMQSVSPTCARTSPTGSERPPLRSRSASSQRVRVSAPGSPSARPPRIAASAGGGFCFAVSLVVAAVAALLSEPGGPPPISGGFAAVGAGCLEWIWRPSRGVMLVVALRRGAPVTPAMVVRSPARPPSCSRTLRCGSSVRSTPPCTCSPGTCFRPGLPPSSRERSAPPGSAVGLSAPGCHEVSVPGRAHRRRPRPGRVDETPDGPPANLLPTRRSPRADRRTDSSPWDLLTTLGRVGTSG